jgi:hypothetical protein
MASRFTISTTLAWLLAAQLYANAQSAPGYYLTQNTLKTGPVQLRVSALGVRLEGQTLTIIIEPDAGTASMYNRKTRTWCQMTDKSLLSTYGAKDVYGKIKPGGTTTMNGHKVTQYYAQAYDSKTQKPTWLLEFFSAKDLNLPQRVEDDIAELMALPRGYGWPLRVVHYKNYGTPQQKQELCLETSDVRQMTTTGNDFLMPAGFTKVKNELTVFTGEDEKEVDDLIDELSKSSNTQHKK